MPTPQTEHRYPCEQCGASLRFQPGQQMLVCDWCGHRQAIGAGPAQAPARQTQGGSEGEDAILADPHVRCAPAISHPAGAMDTAEPLLLNALDRIEAGEHAAHWQRALAFLRIAARFHLEPGVEATLSRDRRAILLRGASGRGWWFRTDGPDVAIEPSVHIDAGLTRRSLQIVVRGSARTDSESKIRWKLSPAGASDPA